MTAGADAHVVAVYRYQPHAFRVIDTQSATPFIGDPEHRVLTIDDHTPIRPPARRICVLADDVLDAGAEAYAAAGSSTEPLARVRCSDLLDPAYVDELVERVRAAIAAAAAEAGDTVGVDVVGLPDVPKPVARFAAKLGEGSNADVAIRMTR